MTPDGLTRRVIDRQALNKAIGAKIRAERKRRGCLQEAVAEIVGVTRSAVANMESGRQTIMLAHLYDLAYAWKLPVSRFLP